MLLSSDILVEFRKLDTFNGLNNYVDQKYFCYVQTRRLSYLCRKLLQPVCTLMIHRSNITKQHCNISTLPWAGYHLHYNLRPKSLNYLSFYL